MRHAAVIGLGFVLLSGCATTLPEPQVSETGFFEAQLNALRTGLPGNYSNFTQAQATGGDMPVTDIVIRSISFDNRATFLVSRRQRGGAVDQHQLYWFAAGPGDSLQLRFAPLLAEQLALPLPQLLDSAQGRFRPGCEIMLVVTREGLSGETRAETCRFQHPQHGEIGLLRELRIGRGEIVIAERLLDDSGQAVAADGILDLLKHRRYTGWSGQRTDENRSVDDPSGWRLSQPLELWDDGMTVPLLDAAGDPLGVSLQLAQVYWKSDQPPVLRLSVVRQTDSQTLAYAFSQPGAKIIGLNLDWFQAGLTAAD